MAAADTTPPADLDRRLRWALAGAVCCLLGLATTWILAAHVPAVRLRDAAALRGFIELQRPWLDAVAQGVLDLIGPIQCTIYALVLALIALRRGRPLLAIGVPLLLGGSVLIAEELKPLLAVPHDFVTVGYQIKAASWPSGHSTAAMAMVMGAVLVAPRRRRPAVAALGGVFTVAVGFSMLMLAWHMPSDVIGGFLLSGFTTAVTVVTVILAERRGLGARHFAGAARVVREVRLRPASRSAAGPAPSQVPTATVAVVLSGVLAAVAARPGQAAGFAANHHSVVAFAAVIAVLAVALVSGAAVALRR